MKEEPTFQVDNVFQALGPRGKYQILMFFLGSLGVFPAAYQLLDAVFIGVEVPHRCAAVPNESIALNLQDHRDAVVAYEECSIIGSVNGSKIAEEGCLVGMEYDLPIDRSVRSQFDLVCGEEQLFNLAQTLVFAGQGVGALIGTAISDRHGRKLVLVGANLGFIPVGMAIAFAPNYLMYAIGKFLAGALQQAIYISKTTYMLEMLPTEDRRLSALFGGLSWAIACMTMALIAFLFREISWRYLHMTFTLTSLMAFIQWWACDESLRWLVANGKMEQSIAVIKRAARINKKNADEAIKAGYSHNQPSLELSLVVEKPDLALNGEDKSGNEKNSDKQELEALNGGPAVTEVILRAKTKKLSLLDLLRTRRLLINTMAMLLAWFTVSLSYFTLYLTASQLSGNRYLNYFLLSLMEAPASLFVYFAFNRIGRKATTIILYAVLGTGLFALGLFKHFSSEKGDVLDSLTLVATLVAVIGASGCFFSVFFYLPELFPTNLRNQALGVASFTARVGAMLAPFTGVLANLAIWAPGLLMGVCASIVCIALLVLPETRDKTLPQTVGELKAWQKKPSSEKQADNGEKDEKIKLMEKKDKMSS